MAINKPNNYENVQVGGEFTPVELGGHHLVVESVTEQKSKGGKDMIVVRFDFSNKDKQAGYFQGKFDDDIRADKKWPRQAAKYIMTEDSEGNCSRDLKTFITCVENSNPGFEPSWGENFCNSFIGKELGGAFGEVEDDYNGALKLKRELRWFVSSDKVDSVDVPAVKHLANQPAQEGAPIGGGFVNIPDGTEAEPPFN